MVFRVHVYASLIRHLLRGRARRLLRRPQRGSGGGGRQVREVYHGRRIAWSRVATESAVVKFGVLVNCMIQYELLCAQGQACMFAFLVKRAKLGERSEHSIRIKLFDVDEEGKQEVQPSQHV